MLITPYVGVGKTAGVWSISLVEHGSMRPMEIAMWLIAYLFGMLEALLLI